MSLKRKFQRSQARKSGQAYSQYIHDVPVSDAFNAATVGRVAGLGGETRPAMVSTESLGLPKISQRLIELIGPQILCKAGRTERQTLVTFAATAWNLGSCELRAPLEDMTKYREEFMAGAKTNGKGFEMLQALIRRRITLFPDDKRIIVNTSVVEAGDEFHIYAAAAGD